MILRYVCKYISVMNECFRNLHIAVYIADCKLEVLYWISNWGMNECLQAVCNSIECFVLGHGMAMALVGALYLAIIHTSFVSTI
jgi:hypothetical protein